MTEPTTFPTEFALDILTDVIKTDLVSRMKNCTSKWALDTNVINKLIGQATKHKLAYHYKFIVFGVAKPGEKSPYLMIFTAIGPSTEKSGEYDLVVGVSISGYDLLDYHKVPTIPVKEIFFHEGESDMKNPPLPPVVEEASSSENIQIKMNLSVSKFTDPIGMNDACRILIQKGYY
jgi:hypothetical protein